MVTIAIAPMPIWPLGIDFSPGACGRSWKKKPTRALHGAIAKKTEESEQKDEKKGSSSTTAAQGGALIRMDESEMQVEAADGALSDGNEELDSCKRLTLSQNVLVDVSAFSGILNAFMTYAVLPAQLAWQAAKLGKIGLQAAGAKAFIPTKSRLVQCLRQALDEPNFHVDGKPLSTSDEHVQAILKQLPNDEGLGAAREKSATGGIVDKAEQTGAMNLLDLKMMLLMSNKTSSDKKYHRLPAAFERA